MAANPLPASCLLFTGINEVHVVETILPAPAADEVLIETLYSSVSPGTELRCLAGRQDQLGDDHFPFIPGYAMVGRVVVPDHRHECPEGTLVFCTGTRRASHRLAWGGHVSHAVVPVGDVLPLPDTVSPLEASLLKLAAIAYRGVRVTQPRPGERVAVVGLGPIGQLSARLFVNAGAEVLAADLSPDRVAIARAAGVNALHVADGLNAVVRTRWANGADVVVDATGWAGALPETVQLVRDRPWQELESPGGKLVVQGSYTGNVPFPQDIAFMKELQVLWPRDCQRSDLLAVLRQLEDGSLHLADLAGVPRPAVSAPEVYAALREPGTHLLTVSFAWNQALLP
jgi:2-desacetyl-2-hydroxyethyl bacteriochlorophyllide A dehydrogenase